MSNLTDTARAMLAVLHGIRDLGGGQHLTSIIPADVRAVLVHLAAKIPGLIRVWESAGGMCNGIDIEADGPVRAHLSFLCVVPDCYEPQVPHGYEDDREAYRELLRLASLDAAPSHGYPPEPANIDPEPEPEEPSPPGRWDGEWSPPSDPDDDDDEPSIDPVRLTDAMTKGMAHIKALSYWWGTMSDTGRRSVAIEVVRYLTDATAAPSAETRARHVPAPGIEVDA